MTTSLLGRVAIVTAASREIGAAMAQALAGAGAAVVVAHFGEPERAEAVVTHIRAAGGQALAVDADLSSVSENRRLVAQAVAAFGRLDIFVANAGLTMWGPFLEVDESTWDAVADLNLKGSYFGAQAAARQMIAQQAADLAAGSGGSAGSFGGSAGSFGGSAGSFGGSAGSFGGSAGSFGGRIIFSSSVTGSVALPNCSAYAVTKAGLFHMARVLGLELGRHAITVNALGIGATVNERNLRDDPAYEAHWAGVNPTGRCGRPEDVASALLYLTDPAAHMINGHTLLIDGGWSTIGAVP